jgi:polyhydroxybutyrate depolymerase
MPFGGAARDFILYVPAIYQGNSGVPVVFDFHGYGSSAAQQIVYGDYRPLADREGFLVVAPDGQGEGSRRHFNLGNEAGLADDVAFTLAILDQLEGELCIDASRVFSTGMSDGGAMTSILACRASDRFAAFGPVAVVIYVPQCDAARSVAIAAFMGTADPIVPFGGGPVHCCDHSVVPAASASMAGWASHNGCKTAADTKVSSQVVIRQWKGCKPGADVRFYMIQGGGHTWPGARFDVPVLGLTTKEISATDTLWSFFVAHPRSS